MSSTTIKCPNYNTDIDEKNILSHQLEDELKQKKTTEKKLQNVAEDE